MSWSKRQLGDLVDFSNGLNFSEKNDGEGLKIVRVKDFGDKHFVSWSDLSEINPRGLKISDKVYLEPDDIVIVRSNGNKDLVGRSMIYAGPPRTTAFAGFCIRARVRKEDAVPQFVHYWLRSPMTREKLSREGGGTGIQNVSQGLLKMQEIWLPPLDEQHRIAAVLGALDDKIELNRKIAVTVEEMARALYRSWFVDFDPVIAKSESRVPAHMDDDTATLFPDGFSDDGLPEGWRSGCLGELADNVRVGTDPSTIDPETPYIGLEHIPRKSITIGEWGVADDVGSTKTQIRMGQFLFGKLRPYFHKVGLVPVDGICSTDILVIEAKQDQWREFVLSAISSADLVDHVNAASTGTRMPRAKWQDLAAYEIAIPPDAVYQRYSKAVRPMHDRILAQIKESRTLAALRDTLLPPLMSGELRVPAAHEIVEETV